MLVGLFGCTPRRPTTTFSAGAYTFTDALGSKITVENPQRVVALMGGFAETWLLSGGKLVGVTDDFLEERDIDISDDIAILGMYNSPNLEEIFALNPDFVILSSETAAHVALKDALRSAGINIAYFKVTFFEDYLDMLRICTEITGREDLYERNGNAVKLQIDSIIAATVGKTPPRVLYLITFSGGARAQNSSTMVGRMLYEMGCENIADKKPSELKDLNIDVIIEEDPDFILVVPMGYDDELAKRWQDQFIRDNPAWNSLTAVKNGRYISDLPKDLFFYKPNARWNESYEYLTDILYG